MKLTPRGLAVAAAALAALGVIGSVLLPLLPWWPFVLFEHFRVQYAFVGVLVIAGCAALRMRGWFDAVVVATLVNLIWIAPDLSRGKRAVPAGTPLRVLLLNVHTSSTAYGDVARLIDDTKPDVLALMEVDERWLAQLAPTVARFAHRIEMPRGDNFGIALYAHASLTGGVESLGSELPTIVATLELHGTKLGIVHTHPIPPVRPALRTMHEAQLAAVAARARALPPPVILMGDFNATPWSGAFRDLMSATGLCDTRAGFGLQASFPASSVVMRIPIDHVLVSCSLGVRSRAIERDVGSDHLPVLVDLVIAR